MRHWVALFFHLERTTVKLHSHCCLLEQYKQREEEDDEEAILWEFERFSECEGVMNI